eukprot:300370-Rhodomonas_salina.1
MSGTDTSALALSPYAMSGTDIGYPAPMCCPVLLTKPSCEVQYSHGVLPAVRSLVLTLIGYGATICGTDVGYGATRQLWVNTALPSR